MSDGVRLPRLTRQELLAVGGDPAMVDAADRDWAERLTADRRAEVVAAAWQGLLERDLARSTDAGMQPDGRLRFITDARFAPTWLAVATSSTVMRAYGVDLPEGDYLLLEHRPTADVASFVGMKLAPGIETLAKYLLLVKENTPIVRRLEVSHPNHEIQPERRLITVDNGRATMATVTPGGTAGAPAATNARRLRKELASLIGHHR